MSQSILHCVHVQQYDTKYETWTSQQQKTGMGQGTEFQEKSFGLLGKRKVSGGSNKRKVYVNLARDPQGLGVSPLNERTRRESV